MFGARTHARLALTYSHTIDDVSDFFGTAGASALAQNSRFRSEGASASFNSRLRFSGYVLLSTPGHLNVLPRRLTGC
jgi:hypothetical protein